MRTFRLRKILPERTRRNFGNANARNVMQFFIHQHKIYLKSNLAVVQDVTKMQNKKLAINMED